MKKFIGKVVFGKIVFIVILITLTLIQFPLNPQGNNLDEQINNSSVLSTQLSAQENDLDEQINNLPVLSAQENDLDEQINNSPVLSAQENDLTKNLFSAPQKNKSLPNQEVDFLVKNQTLLINTEPVSVLAQNSNLIQDLSINTQENLYAQKNTSQESGPILDTLISEDQEIYNWEFIGKVVVDWDIKSTTFSPTVGNEKKTETSNDTFYLDLSYKKKEQVGINLELYPSKNLKLESFITFMIASVRFNTGFNYDTRQDFNKATGYFQVSGRDGFYGRIFKDKGLESPHQGGDNLIVETEKQKSSIKNRENSITEAIESYTLDNDYYNGLEVGFARKNINFKIILELGAGISSAFGSQKYDNAISLIDFYNAAIDSNSIFTNDTYFGTTTASLDAAYQKINSILVFADSANVIAAAGNSPAITSLISEAQSFITDARRAGATASSLTPTTTNDIYQTTVLNFHRSEEVYNLFNNIALEVLGLDINNYKNREYATSDLLATDAVNAIDDFLSAKTLLENSVTNIVPDFEPFPSDTVSGNIALKFDHQWKSISYGLLATKGSYSGKNWFGNTSIVGGSLKFKIGRKFNFFVNSFNSSLITTYEDKYFINSTTKNIDIKTENLTSNLNYGIDYTWGSKSGLSLAISNGEITQKHNSTTGALAQYEKKNSHSITEIGYKTKFGSIDFKAGIANVVEQGKSTVNQNLPSLDGSHNLVDGDKLTTTIYKVRFEQNF